MQRGSTNESSMHDFSTSALHYPVNAWNSSTNRINLHLLKSIGGYAQRAGGSRGEFVGESVDHWPSSFHE